MADFYQTGVVTTLHRLKPNSVDRLELDLERFSRNKPIGLVLPALYSEFETPAMQGIVPELRKVKYLERIVLVLGRATRGQYLLARSFFRDFYTPVTVLWVDSPRIQSLLTMLGERGLSAGADGKGRSCWLPGFAIPSFTLTLALSSARGITPASLPRCMVASQGCS
jgi:glucosyl-3-phosphoglycerate synthase